jgi:DNA (cytosine-5)-methyltransferase 1
MGQNAQFAPCIDTEVEPPMMAKGPGAVAHPVYSTSKSSYHTLAEENLVNTLVATDYKDPPIVTEEPYYIVRRLTPTECARLQGFPDWWCACLGTEEPTEQDIEFWREVFETHRQVTGSAAKPKSDAQLVKWLKDPHADSAEYKLWGNGVALPCVCFVLSGIVYYDQSEG